MKKNSWHWIKMRYILAHFLMYLFLFNALFSLFVVITGYPVELSKDRAINALIFSLVMSSLFFFCNWILNLKYIKCPYCNKSVEVILNWKCDYCSNSQNEKRSIFSPCVHCHRSLKSAFCEFCNTEVRF